MRHRRGEVAAFERAHLNIALFDQTRRRDCNFISILQIEDFVYEFSIDFRYLRYFYAFKIIEIKL